MIVSLRAVAVAIALAALAGSSAAAGAFEPGGCSETAPALVSVRDAAGLRGHCDFIATCPVGTSGGCFVRATVTVTGTGFVDAEISGPAGALRCPIRSGECSLSAIWPLPPGPPEVYDCSATGVALNVTYSCALEAP